MNLKHTKTNSLFLACAFLCITAVTSCRKYDEGGPRNRNAEKNLANEWAREKGFKNGEQVSQVAENPQIGEVTEDMIFYGDGNYKSENGTVTITGTWRLVSNRKQVEITINSPSSLASTYAYDIIKLTEGSDGQFIFEHELDGNKYRFECRSSR